MKNAWRPILLVFLALILACSVVACAESYTQEDLDVVYGAGHAEGYDTGSHAGYKVGYEVGYEEGKDKGYQLGYEDGERYGYSVGFQDAMEKIVDEWFLAIISVSSPVNPGDYATLRAKTLPNALCSIDVYYKSGKSEATGLYSHRADNEGWISWIWKVGTRTTSGRWKIVVTASDVDGWFPGETVISKTIYFEVK